MHPSCGRRFGRPRRACRGRCPNAHEPHCVEPWEALWRPESGGIRQILTIDDYRMVEGGFRGTLVAAVNALLLTEKARRKCSIDEASVSSNHCDLSV